MAYDEELAQRLRERLDGEPVIAEKRMFGGLAFLSEGHMTVAASGQGGLLVRIDPDQADAALAEPHAQPMEMRGKPMRGWIRVDAAGVADDDALQRWIDRSFDYVRTLPPK